MRELRQTRQQDSTDHRGKLGRKKARKRAKKKQARADAQRMMTAVGEEVVNDDGGVDKVCVICCGGFGKECTTTLCSHLYHWDCLEMWIDRCASDSLALLCPMCKYILVVE